MGTRSLTIFKDEDGKTLATLYRQMDGYPEGHGVELAEFLAPFTIVNGYSGREKQPAANGLGCLAAQAIAHFKTKSGIGGFYLYPEGAKDVGEEYVYEVTGTQMTCFEVIGFETTEDRKLVFKGLASDFLARFGKRTKAKKSEKGKK